MRRREPEKKRNTGEEDEEEEEEEEKRESYQGFGFVSPMRRLSIAPLRSETAHDNLPFSHVDIWNSFPNSDEQRNQYDGYCYAPLSAEVCQSPDLQISPVTLVSLSGRCVGMPYVYVLCLSMSMI
jgi:hypothetical protein